MSVETMKTKLFNLLRKIGFPNDAARLLLRILDIANSSKEHIINLNIINSSSSKNALNWLTKNGVISISLDEQGRQYVSIIHPKVFLYSFYLKKSWSILPVSMKFSDLSKSKSQIVKLNEYKNTCDEIESILLNYSIFTPKDFKDMDMSYIPPENLPTALADSIYLADKEILGIVIPLWTPNISLIWASILKKIKSNVVYRRISDEYTWIAFGYEINKRDIYSVGVNLRILPSELVNEKFFVIDDKLTLLFTPSISQNNFELEAMRVTLPYIVDLQREKFEEMWVKAIEAETLLKYMDDIKERFLTRGLKVTPTARDFLEGLFDYGIFFDENIPDENIIDQLRKHSVVIDEPCSHSGVIPNLIEDIRVIIQNYKEQRIMN